jgi:hypothetical protein
MQTAAQVNLSWQLDGAADGGQPEAGSSEQQQLAGSPADVFIFATADRCCDARGKLRVGACEASAPPGVKHGAP